MSAGTLAQPRIVDHASIRAHYEPAYDCRFTNHQKPLAILRAKTMEVLGKTQELVKAAATRFGTHVLVGKRLMEVKVPLQQTVVDGEYAAQGYKDDADVSEQSNAQTVIRQHKGGTAKKLVLDDAESGFWHRVEEYVHSNLPIFKMLRRHDSSAPTVGKVFHGWFEIGEHIQQSTAPYKEVMVDKHKDPFLRAAYVVDPEFVDHSQGEDEHLMSAYHGHDREDWHCSVYLYHGS